MSTAAEYWGKSEQAASKLRTMTSFCRSSGDVKSVPDPYYGGPQVRRLEFSKPFREWEKSSICLKNTPAARSASVFVSNHLGRPPQSEVFSGETSEMLLVVARFSAFAAPKWRMP